MKCHYCSKEINDNSSFCRFCGKAVPKEAKKSEPKKKRLGLQIMLLFVIVATLSGVALGFLEAKEMINIKGAITQDKFTWTDFSESHEVEREEPESKDDENKKSKGEETEDEVEENKGKKDEEKDDEGMS